MSARYVQIILFLAIGCFLISSVFLSHHIAQRQDALQSLARYDLGFSVGQALSEFTRLKERVAAHGVPGADVDTDEVQLRLDILFSRLDSLQTGELRAFMSQDADRLKTIASLYDALNGVQSRIPRISEPSVAGEIYGLLAPFDAEMASLAAAGHQTGTRQVAEDQDRLLHLHSVFTWLAFGLIGCGLSFIILLMCQNRLLGHAQKHLRRLAHYDPLTGLANRVLFAERLGATLGAGEQDRATTSILCFDLDCFKEVNDTLGHHVGDEVLKAVAERVTTSVGQRGLIARLGGDEFAVVVTGLPNVFDCTAIASEIIEAIRRPYDIEGHKINIGVSIGISSSSGDAHDAEALLKQADLALYHAKAGGKGRFHFFESDMNERLQIKKRLEADLRRALDNGEMEIHYQEIIDAKLSQITGFEALIRWRHPSRGMISPSEFIPIAEETGMIVGLGEWVLREACVQANAWPEHLRVAVNLSPAQFRGHSLVQTVANALEISGLASRRLELEITETVLLEDSDATLAILTDLSKLGVQIAMDDFGTGYSSLSYLRRFPFNRIKIDQSFVRDLSVRTDSLAIIEMIATLGRTLGMTTTAEGVETETQFEQVRAAGCNEVQGFLFARPEPAAKLRMELAVGSKLRSDAA